MLQFLVSTYLMIYIPNDLLNLIKEYASYEIKVFTDKAKIVLKVDYDQDPMAIGFIELTKLGLINSCCCEDGHEPPDCRILLFGHLMASQGALFEVLIDGYDFFSYEYRINFNYTGYKRYFEIALNELKSYAASHTTSKKGGCYDDGKLCEHIEFCNCEIDWSDHNLFIKSDCDVYCGRISSCYLDRLTSERISLLWTYQTRHWYDLYCYNSEEWGFGKITTSCGEEIEYVINDALDTEFHSF